MITKNRVLVIQKTSAVGWTEFVVTKHMIERLLQQNISNMPSGTVYAKYAPMYFEELCIKGDSLPNDFFTTDLHQSVESNNDGDLDKALEKAENGFDVPMGFNIETRDGCFDEDQLFAVWSKDDVLGLVAKLNEVVL